MKITKKANLALLVMLTAVSILPGCGKSKNNEQIGGGAVVGPPPPVAAPNSNAYISNATGWLYGNAPITGGISGNVFIKTNGSGDTLTIGIVGNPVGQLGYTNVYVSANFVPGPGTVAYFNQYCGGAPTMIIFSGTNLQAGTPGSVGGMVRVQAPNGCGLVI